MRRVAGWMLGLQPRACRRKLASRPVCIASAVAPLWPPEQIVSAGSPSVLTCSTCTKTGQSASLSTAAHRLCRGPIGRPIGPIGPRGAPAHPGAPPRPPRSLGRRHTSSARLRASERSRRQATKACCAAARLELMPSTIKAGADGSRPGYVRSASSTPEGSAPRPSAGCTPGMAQPVTTCACTCHM